MSPWYEASVAMAFTGGVVLFGVLDLLKRLKELHHGYYGVLLMLLPWAPAAIVGGVLLFDDLRQHFVQVIDAVEGRHPRPDFTLIHRIGQWILWTPPRPPLAWFWA